MKSTSNQAALRLFALVMAAASLPGCQSAQSAGALKFADLRLQGVQCKLCLPKVEAALSKVKGYRRVEFQGIDAAKVTYDPSATTPAALIKSVNTNTSFHLSERLR